MTPFTASERADLQRAGENYERGKAAVAEKFARKVLKAHPRSPELLQFVAAIVKAQGRAEEAVDLCQKAAVLAPQDAQVHYNLGTALIDTNRFEDAIASLRLAVERQPNNADYQTNLALALLKCGKFYDAEQIANYALQLKPLNAAAFVVLAFSEYGQRKLDAAIASFRAALNLQPKSSSANFGLASCYFTCNRFTEALSAINQSLANGNEKQASALKSAILTELGRMDEALACLIKVNDQNQTDSDALAKQLQYQRRLVQWQGEDKCIKQLVDLVSKSATAQPWDLLSFIEDPQVLLDYTRKFSASYRYAVEPTKLPVKSAVRSKIRLAYVSSDLRDHIVGHLVKAIASSHDRDRFDVLGVSLLAKGVAEIGSDMRSSFDEFHEVGGRSNTEIAKTIGELGADIAVDLNGFTSGNFHAVFAAKIAPIQVNYLGYAGTSGAPWMDYIVADPVIVQEGDEKFYAEKVMRIPCLLPTNYSGKPPDGVVRKSEFGLPDDAFVFCCFNHILKIGPEQFDIWMQILNSVPNSVLWLRVENDVAQERLRAEARKRGVEGQRIVFATYLPFDDHLKRLRAADLFLDAWPYGAHTTATDALWSGVPLLSYPGRSFASRVSASLLNYVGLTDLIAGSIPEYIFIATTFATDRSAWLRLRAKVDALRCNSPLFDIRSYVMALEATFEQMFQVHRQLQN